MHGIDDIREEVNEEEEEEDDDEEKEEDGEEEEEEIQDKGPTRAPKLTAVQGRGDVRGAVPGSQVSQAKGRVQLQVHHHRHIPVHHNHRQMTQSVFLVQKNARWFTHCIMDQLQIHITHMHQHDEKIWASMSHRDKRV